jgi:hypothetical protein
LGLGFRVLWLTFRSDFFRLTFLTFWFDGCCGVGSGDSGMPGRLPIGHLWMSYGWMKFVVLEFHPLILHAS